MLYGYFAVGGLEDSQGCCLCGFIAEADDWNRCDHAWRAVLAHFGAGFDAAACFAGTGIFQRWDISRRQAFLESLSEVLTGPALVPLGSFVVGGEFSRLSSADRAILSAEGIERPFDLIVYDLTQRIICRVHEESEKISLLFDREPQSATERCPELFNKYLGRYLLWPHLMGALAFADARDCSQLQAAKLLAETVFLCETQGLFTERERSFFSIPSGLHKMTERIHKQAAFDGAKMNNLTAKLKAVR